MNYKLTSAQQSFNTEMITGNIPVWNNVLYVLFDEKIEYDDFSNILNEIFKENSMLRTSFFKNDDGQVMQKINEYQPQKFECLLFESKKEIDEFAKKEANIPTLICENPLKFYVIKLENKIGCLVKIHHILFDGLCTNIFIDKLKSKLGILNVEDKIYSYEKIFDSEESFIGSPRYNRSIKYWNKKLKENFTSSIYDFESSDDYSANELWFAFDKEKIGLAKEICQSKNIPFSAFVYTAFALYVNKNIDITDFSIGMPMINRMGNDDMHTLGLFMHILPLIVHIDESLSCLSNLERIYDEILELSKHQKFTQYDININCNNIQQLFDVVVNYNPLSFLPDCEFNWFRSSYSTAPLDFRFHEESDSNVNLQILYRKKLFQQKDIEGIFNQFKAIIDAFVENPNAVIKDIVLESNEKIDQNEIELLNKFNDTKSEYAKTSIKELFEEKVEQNANKTALVAIDKALTYQELNEDANRIANSLLEKGIGVSDIVAYKLPRKSYLISTILGIIKAGATYLPIDPDYPQDRIEYMLEDSGAKLCITEENITELLNNSNTQNPNINISPESAIYCIYTSGSTGMPKGTLISHKNIANYICNNQANQMATVFKENNCNSIASITTVSFDIFVSESLLPICNDMTVVLASDEQSKNQSKLNEISADAIQTTPTKMRMLIANKDQLDYLKKLKVIVLGGEAVDAETVNRLKSITSARIYNFYGPTETTVWSTSCEITDSKDITIGKPIANTQVYIVNDDMQLVPIGVTGELCIAGDGVCLGYHNKPELTAEKFINNPFGEGKLYKTGDLAYWREDGNIVYVGRNDFQVKIRGLRIELGEIENAINGIDGIEQSVAVVRKDNEDRQIICAFYTGEELTTAEIKKVISSNLPQYMLPHIVKHIEAMPTTDNGKLNRKALPEFNLDNIESAVEYVEAQTEQEKVLVNSIKTVLNKDQVSTLDNFFDIGGDSLKSVELIAKLEENGFTVNQRVIFDSSTIKELATNIKTSINDNTAVEYNREMPATGLEMIAYTAQIIDGASTLYNIPYVFKVENLDVNRLEYAVNEMIERHESLRTHFENRDGVVYQVIDEPKTITATKFDNRDLSLFVKPFDLSKSPLVHLGYCDNTVMIDFHHIIADGESMPIFFNELNELYMGRELNNQPKQYGEFAASVEYTKENEDYWLSVFEDSIPNLNLNTDFPRPAIQSFEGTAFYDEIDFGLHNRITEKCRKLGVTNYVFYMSAINILLSKYSSSDDIVVGIPANCRTTKYIDSIGMYVNTLPIRNKVDSSKTVFELLQKVKNNSINAIENQNYPYGNIIKNLDINVKEKSLNNVMFTYQSEGMTDIVFADKVRELTKIPMTTAKTDMLFYVLPSHNRVTLMVEYCTKLFKQSTIERLANSFNLILEQMLDENKQIKDISAVDNVDLILNDFNATNHQYIIEDSSTIYSLFEKTAKKNANEICITANENSITFTELQEISEALDSQIRNKVNSKSIIAVIADRSIEMYSAVYGIIRGGNAYLPIDPNYPLDRINYILENSGAELVVAQGKYANLASKTPCINMTDFLENTPVFDAVPPCNATEDDTAYVIYTSGSTGQPKGAKISHKSAVNRIAWMHDLYPLEKDDVILQKTPYTFDVSVWELFWWGMFGGKLVASKPNEHFVPEKILEEVEKNKVTHLHFVPSVFDVFLSYLEKNADEVNKFNSAKHVFLSGEALTSNLIKRFYKLYDYKNVKLHNLYGPTECAVDVTYYDCKPSDVDPVPIGKPIYNTQMYVLDKDMQPLPIGVTGELHIGGVNVGQGYLNNESLTNERFVDNTFGEGKLYKTGDLAYWREDGNIVYVGRNDFQVKVRGLRIELGEIENAINGIDEIEQSVVVVRKDKEDRQIICAFYTGEELATAEIKKAISANLPQYMFPNSFNHIDKIPLTISGKIDRNVLSRLEIAVESVQNTNGAMPETESEKHICKLFSEILSVDNVHMDSDFYELGGNSLDLIRLLSYEEFDDIKVADFMINPTPKGLVKLLNSNNTYKYLDSLYMPNNVTKALVLFPFAGGNASGYSALVNEFKENNSSIALFYVDWLNNSNDYIETAREIKILSKEYETNFYSHCAGAVIALKLLDVLPENCINTYIAGATLPLKMLFPINLWRLVSDRLIIKYLEKVGFKSDMIDDFVLKKMISQFRNNTKEIQLYFYNKTNVTKANMISIISKNDPFTSNYSKADELWNKVVSNYKKTILIDSDSHYFQKDNANELFEILSNILKEDN